MTTPTPSLRDAAQIALEALVYHQQQTRPISKTDAAIGFLSAALALPEPEPYCWMVQGTFGAYTGDYAEAGAKAEAKRIGGTCQAFALYKMPPAAPVERQPLTIEQASRAGRVLSDRCADACAVDREVSWREWGQGFIDDARAAIEAALGIGPASKG